MRGTGVDGTEGVHQLVGLAVVPAGVVDSSERGPDVVEVLRSGLVVVGDVGDAAIRGGVDEHEVLAISPVEPLSVQLRLSVEVGVVAGGRQGHVVHDESAVRVGDPSDMANTTGFQRAVGVHLIGLAIQPGSTCAPAKAVCAVEGVVA